MMGTTAALATAPSALAGGFTARLYAPTHTPKVGRMSIEVTATRGSQRLSGSVKYRFLYSGQLVSTQPGHSFSNGVFRDALIWPKRSVGYTITLQVVVKTSYGTDYLDWWIKVRS
jgi:hypothetical protein